MAHFTGKVVCSLNVAVQGYEDGQIDSKPKVKPLVKKHGKAINDYPPRQEVLCPCLARHVPRLTINAAMP